MLRFLAGLFIHWPQVFTLLPPEWAMIGLIAVLFAWGFSQRISEISVKDIPTEQESSRVGEVSHELVE